MEIQTQNSALKQVLLNKIRHSKYTGGGEEEDTHFKELNFKFSSDDEEKITSYLNEFKPAIYYEWSKRQNEYYSSLFLSCLFIKRESVFRSVRLYSFNNNSSSNLGELTRIDKILKKILF